jgi:hypothetical protein
MQCVGGESNQKLEKTQKAMDWRVCEWDDIGERVVWGRVGGFLFLVTRVGRLSSTLSIKI